MRLVAFPFFPLLPGSSHFNTTSSHILPLSTCIAKNYSDINFGALERIIHMLQSCILSLKRLYTPSIAIFFGVTYIICLNNFFVETFLIACCLYRVLFLSPALFHPPPSTCAATDTFTRHSRLINSLNIPWNLPGIYLVKNPASSTSRLRLAAPPPRVKKKKSSLCNPPKPFSIPRASHLVLDSSHVFYVVDIFSRRRISYLLASPQDSACI